LGRTGGAPVFSAFSIIAVLAAVGALFVNGGGLTLLLAIVAIIFGLLGMVVAFLPSRRGGIMSFIAVGVGLLAVIIAIVRLVGGHSGSTGAY
jgi:hypothetical protein